MPAEKRSTSQTIKLNKMEKPHCDKTPTSKLEIEAVQTIPPFKPTDPRQTRQVSVADPVGSGIFKGCFNVVFYFKKVMKEDSGWKVAGWIKESLARALVEQPILSGRLRRDEDGNGPGLEIVSNDCGLRLIEAKTRVTLEEFLDAKESNEAELVFWKDVDEESPQFSPLCYVQVTNFECGGYSIGISCNILLADLLITGNFLKNWAHIHRDIVSKHDALKTPIFYLPNLKNTSSSPAISIFCSDQRNNCGQTMIFRVTDKTVLDLENDSGKTLMLSCVEAAERELGSNMASKFPVFLKESPDVLKIESCLKLEPGLCQSQLNLGSHVTHASLDDLEGNDIVFKEGNKPTRVTYWIGSVTEGLLMAFTSPEEAGSGLNIIVSVPREDKNN